jgi:hypothetical protein
VESLTQYLNPKIDTVRSGQVLTVLSGGRAIVRLGSIQTIAADAHGLAEGQAVTVARAKNGWRVVGDGGRVPGADVLEVTIDG